MNESGPIIKTHKDLDPRPGFYDFLPIAPHVWRATFDGKYWVLKTSEDDTTASQELLRREWEISCNLQHPFIAAPNRFEENTPKGPAIVLEYVDGCTLRGYIAKNPSDAARHKVLNQILDAVQYLHQCDLLHNDLKPENILVTAIGGNVKIIDFGYSETDADFLNQKLGGTKGFSAPEVLSGNEGNKSSASSDIYSLGRIIRLLFPGKKFSGIIGKCLQDNPTARFQSVDSLRSAINRRKRLPYWIAGAAIVIVLLAASVTPIISQKVKQVRRQAEITRIQSDMQSLCSDIADSLGNRTLVPYQEFAFDTRGTFVKRFAQYRESISDPESLTVCDSIYARIIRELTELMLDIPRFEDLHEQGLLSDKEEMWYLHLRVKGLRYKPYNGQ